MEFIRTILSFVVRLAVGLLIFALVMWLVTALFPKLKVRNFVSFDEGSGTLKWLPPPGSWGGLLAQKQVMGDENVFVAKEPFNGYGLTPNQPGYKWSQVAFVTYTKDGTEVVTRSPDGEVVEENGKGEAYSPRELYVRNLSFYQGGAIYSGISFGGEARESMFRDGRFRIIIADHLGRPVASSYAYMTNTWAPAGWRRFQTKLEGSLPDKVSCTMVFESANAQSNGKIVRVAMPVLCSYR